MATRMVKLGANATVPPHKPGDEVEIDVDSHGTPTDRNWRRKLNQGSITFMDAPKTSKRNKPAEAGPKETS